jgi:hypothetical protein
MHGNEQFIFEDPPDALNAQRHSGCSQTDPNQELRHSSVGETIREVLNNVRWQVIQSLTPIDNASAKSGYYNVLGADGNFRCCKPILAAEVADHP